MLKNDIREGSLRKTGYLLLLAAVVVISCTGMDNLIREMINQGETIGQVSYADMLVYLFSGEPEAQDLNVFHLPIYWCVYQMIIAATVAGFIRADLQNYGTMKIIYSGSRGRYARSKMVWVGIHTLYCYLFVYGITAVYTAARGYAMNFHTNEILWSVTAGMSQPVKTGQIILLLMVMPVLVTLALTYIQIFGELLYGSAFGYFCICVILAVSSFWKHPLLSGNYSMTCRSRYMAEGGVSAVAGIVYCLVIIVMMLSVIMQSIRRFDVLQEQDVL